MVLARGRLRQRAPKPLAHAAAVGLGVCGSPLHHSSEFTLHSRGCAGEDRGLTGAAGAGGQPPHEHVIQRTRKPSPHSRRPGVTQPEEGRPLLSAGLAASSSTQLPDQLCAGHARFSTQHGVSDHRRPSNVETGTPRHPLVPPKNTTRNKQESRQGSSPMMTEQIRKMVNENSTCFPLLKTASGLNLRGQSGLKEGR